MRKTLMFNNHSKNNAMLFALTAKNHAQYASHHEYDMLNLDMPYVLFLDFNFLRALLKIWPQIILIGSDIWFTNMKIDASTLAHPDDALTVGPDPCANFPVNGDFYIIQNTPHTDNVFNRIDELQNRPGMVFGHQEAMKIIIEEGGMEGINVLPPRVLQSFPRHTDILKPVREDTFWQPGDLCIHFVGGCNIKKCLDVLAFDQLGVVYNLTP